MPSGWGGATRPALDVDSTGTVHVAWGAHDAGEFNSSGAVCYAMRDPASSVLDGDMALDGEGNAYLAWTDRSEAWEESNTALRLRTTTVASDTAAPQVTKHYYANGQRIATRANGALYYILGDHLGSTSLVTDENGDEVGYVIYDAYGQIVENTLPATLTDRLFTGQTLDASTGLYYYNSRYLDPVTGGFTQMDSLVGDAFDPRAWNRTAYVYANPVNYTDSSGHFIDEPFDLLDLGIDSVACLSGDAGSCLFLPYDVLALVVPGLPGSYGNQAFRAADWMDGVVHLTHQDRCWLSE